MSERKLPMQPKARDLCPACKSSCTKQYKTESYSESYVIRYHRCARCQARFTTEETREPDKRG